MTRLASQQPVGGYTSGSGTQNPYLNINKGVGSAYNQATEPIQGILGPYQIGLTDTIQTRNATNDMLSAYGDGQRARIDDEFQTTANNAAGKLASRGFGGSSLQLTEALGVERERQLARGTLEDQIIGQRLSNSQNYASLIAQQTGQSGDAQTSLMRALLGLSESQDTRTSPIQRTDNTGGGGSGGGLSGGQIQYGAPDLGYRDLADGVSGGGQQAGGGGGSGGGGSGGGGTGGGIVPGGGAGDMTTTDGTGTPGGDASAAWGGGPQTINNPYMGPEYIFKPGQGWVKGGSGN